MALSIRLQYEVETDLNQDLESLKVLRTNLAISSPHRNRRSCSEEPPDGVDLRFTIGSNKPLDGMWLSTYTAILEAVTKAKCVFEDSQSARSQYLSVLS